MPESTFRGDPYRVLDVSPDASASTIKRRWRELAREHHPDKAAGDRAQADELTVRMARINAAYDLLRDPLRRRNYDESPAGRRSSARSSARAGRGSFEYGGERAEWSTGPPPPPPSPPVTARFDTSAAFRPRNTTLTGLSGYSAAYAAAGPHARPRVRRAESDEVRASTPSGPVERRRNGRAEPQPSLREARETVLAFGKHRGYTLGQVELLEPTYIDWIAQTITRDRDLVVKARVIQSEMNRQGVVRRVRPTAPGFGSRPAAPAE